MESRIGRFGAAGEKRAKKEKPSTDERKKWNRLEKARRCKYRLLEYFTDGDLFVTLTYKKKNRPDNVNEAVADFQRIIRKIRNGYKKQRKELRWIRNIEMGKKGAFHIHLVINEVGNTLEMLRDAWEYGGIYAETIRNSFCYSEDLSQLAWYLTKEADSHYESEEIENAHVRGAKETSYSTSRNMPLPEPEVEYVDEWKDVPQVPDGYRIISCITGINPVTGQQFRRYTLVKDEQNTRKRGNCASAKARGALTGI